ncbi:PREDICTED: host cell factor 1-like [Priapulus caudatus]|uniref:Host cell factor 1-like n=1 Tax=Priapulus caudatus TaxID=37621 RepID=A0ABM1DUI9_PRICU|nr:PREDICTED: host cell factor 1-like [Priapulus caudatus]
MTWTKPMVSGIPPLPRSLHSAELIGSRMFVFGGWVPLVMDDVKVATHEKEWKCTNTLASLNIDTTTWEPLAMEVFEDAVPRARAGHCSVAINTRLYIWSGRDGYRKAWNNQVCCKDLWFLETEKPPASSRVQLVRASTNTLEVSWGSVPTAEAYLLQLQKFEMPPQQAMAPAGTPVPINTPKTYERTPVMAVHPPQVKSPTQLQTIRLPAAALSSISNNPAGTTILRAGGGQQLKVVGSTAQLLSGAQMRTISIAGTTATATTSMTGIAALAAAAAQTQKITMTQSSPTTSIRVVTPQGTVMTPQGLKLQTGQQVRLTTPATTILKTAAGVAGQQLGGKQIITVQKTSGGVGQPQIVTLVKTTQGMQVQQVQQQPQQQQAQVQVQQPQIQTVPKMSIVQAGQNRTIQTMQLAGVSDRERVIHYERFMREIYTTRETSTCKTTDTATTSKKEGAETNTTDSAAAQPPPGGAKAQPPAASQEVEEEQKATSPVVVVTTDCPRLQYPAASMTTSTMTACLTASHIGLTHTTDR